MNAPPRTAAGTRTHPPTPAAIGTPAPRRHGRHVTTFPRDAGHVTAELGCRGGRGAARCEQARAGRRGPPAGVDNNAAAPPPAQPPPPLAQPAQQRLARPATRLPALRRLICSSGVRTTLLGRDCSARQTARRLPLFHDGLLVCVVLFAWDLTSGDVSIPPPYSSRRTPFSITRLG